METISRHLRDPNSIPPLPENGLLDVERDILVTCRHCPSLSLTPADLPSHIKAHDRWNHLQAASRVERCVYYAGLKKSKNLLKAHNNQEGINNIVPIPDAELVKGMYTCFSSTLEEREGQLPFLNTNTCKGKAVARCAVARRTSFAALKYLEDQTYTFGDRYWGRGEQGEFIPLRRDRYFANNDNKKTINYFQIVCKGGRYWIRKTMDEDALVFVNEVLVTVNEFLASSFGCVGEDENEDGMLLRMIALEPGDIISTSCAKYDWIRQDFLFKLKLPVYEDKRENRFSSAGIKEEGKSLSHYFMDNTVVLYQILRRMKMEDLLPLRLVAHSWNQEALSILKNSVVLTPFRERQGSDWDSRESSESKNLMALFNLAQDLGPVVAIKKWDVDLSPSSYYWRDMNVVHKLRDDFEWLFSLNLTLTSHVTQLSLAGSEDDDDDGETIRIILAAFADNLEVLKLKLGLPSLVTMLVFPPSMPWVSTCVLDGSSLWYLRREDVSKEEECIKALFLALPRLRFLTLEEWRHLGLTFHALVAGREGRSPPCAVSIILGRQIYIDGVWLQDALSVPSFPSSFYVRALSGGTVVKGEPSLSDLLYQLLKKWGPTLEELELKIRLCSPAAPSPFLLVLPSPMPKLTRLSLVVGAVGHDHGGIRLEIAGENENVLDYSKTFPCLRVLQLLPDHVSDGWWRVFNLRWDDIAQMYDTLLPPNEDGATVCDTLRVCEVPFVLEGETRRSVEEIQMAFPNLNNPPTGIMEVAGAEEEAIATFPDFMTWPAFDWAQDKDLNFEL